MYKVTTNKVTIHEGKAFPSNFIVTCFCQGVTLSVKLYLH